MFFFINKFLFLKLNDRYRPVVLLVPILPTVFCSISLFGGSNQKYQAVEVLFPIVTFRACLFRKKKTTEKFFFIPLYTDVRGSL